MTVTGTLSILRQPRGTLLRFTNGLRHLSQWRQKSVRLSMCGLRQVFREHCSWDRSRLSPFIAATSIAALAFGIKAADDKINVDEDVISEADVLYELNEVNKLYKFLLEYKDSQNDEIQWRLARATSDKSKAESNETLKKQLTRDALTYAEKAVNINDKNFAAHKWYAILLDYTGRYENTKYRIKNSFKVKDHLCKAVELNPHDATSIHSLGYWCYVFADMPWYQRKIASVLFATPPTATYEDALRHFLEAEKVDPNFYSMNLLMLGKTYLRLGDNETAAVYLNKASNHRVTTEDDKVANKEATELLRNLKMK